jgi:hypothetical protein
MAPLGSAGVKSSNVIEGNAKTPRHVHEKRAPRVALEEYLARQLL